MVSVQPANIVYTSPSQGARFNENITIENVTNCVSVQLNLTFNGNLMSIVGESFFPTTTVTPNWQVGTGFMSMDNSFNPSLTVGNTPSIIATLTFKLNSGYGISAMNITNLIVTNSTGGSVPTIVQNGTVEVDVHDVAINSITASSYWGQQSGYLAVYSGGIVNVTVVASNLGSTSENFTVTVYANATLSVFNVTNLASGQNTTLFVSWNTSSASDGSYYVLSAQASLVPYEINAANNVLSGPTVHVKKIGDVNGDDNVDVNDLIAWDASYGSTPSSPNWNIQADINGDGIVNQADGILIIENYHT
jgi:hypothetical protein